MQRLTHADGSGRPARGRRRLARRHRLAGLSGVLAAVVLAAAPAALAHGGTNSRLYLSEVRSVKPPLAGVTVTVLGRDDRIELDDAGKARFVVLGYENEPYLRFGPKGVEVNVHSPARYLNDDRYARVALPPEANAKAAPSWKVETLGTRWSWHDHRIHWMSTALPPVAQAAPKVRHLVFDWSIPLRVERTGGAVATATIAGSLFYVPPKSDDTGLIVGIALPVAVVLLAGGATGLLVLRRRRLLAEAQARAGEREPES